MVWTILQEQHIILSRSSIHFLIIILSITVLSVKIDHFLSGDVSSDLLSLLSLKRLSDVRALLAYNLHVARYKLHKPDRVETFALYLSKAHANFTVQW